VAVTAFPESRLKITGVRDSKKCSKEQIRILAPMVANEADFLGVGYASAEMINKHGLAYAWQQAANMALSEAPILSLLIVDGQRSVDSYHGKQRVEPKADVNFWQVAAASIVAKHARDADMEELAAHYPGYGWERNVGYGTAEHIDALFRLGVTPFHRFDYAEKAMRNRMLKEQAEDRPLNDLSL
jgi:ribonuclease HII